MSKDIDMIKGQDKIKISEDKLAKYENLGYKKVSGDDKVVKLQPKKPEFKPKLKEE